MYATTGSQEYTITQNGATQAAAATYSYAPAQYTNYVYTSYETPTPSAYSPVQNSSPATLLATPAPNGYAAVFTPTSQASPSTSTMEYMAATPYQYSTSHFYAFQSPYPQAQLIPSPPQAYISTPEPVQVQQCENVASNNKENQRPRRQHHNKGGKRNPNYDYKKRPFVQTTNENSSSDYEYYHLKQPRQQSVEQPLPQQVYYNDYNVNTKLTTTATAAATTPSFYYTTEATAAAPAEYLPTLVTHIPCNEITNYAAPSPVPQQQPQMYSNSPSYYHSENSNDSYHDPEEEKLACTFCRGKKKCFCYFLKVGYNKFPSFMDFCEHHSQLNMRNMQQVKQKSRKM